MEQKFVACFAEGEFEVVVGPFEMARARGWIDGFFQGAGSYGAGSPSAYVLPDEAAEMRSEECEDEVDRALAEYHRRRPD